MHAYAVLGTIVQARVLIFLDGNAEKSMVSRKIHGKRWDGVLLDHSPLRETCFGPVRSRSAHGSDQQW